MESTGEFLASISRTVDLPISAIQVTGRHRKELGDLRPLAASIAAVGLLHPVVVTTEHRLVAGQRRLEACKLLGHATVPARVISTLSQALKMLEAERDENVCRLEMLPSEKAALGMSLEEYERRLAQERRREGNAKGGRRRAGEVEDKISSTSQGRNKPRQTRDLVGDSVGLSGTSYERARKVVKLAAEGVPEAIEALAEMDKTGKITPAYAKATGNDPNVRATRSRPQQPKASLKDALAPLRKYLKGWDETRLKGVTPPEAKRLLSQVAEVREALFEVERALSERTVVSRALR